ncbi:MAG: 23S rRNA (pseudouridine(1915)-N(3))-methyltransferase RlmH [Bacteroidota bacterium]|nr:23S rRNA (pseudouridine(1915)-N(3))-methyltransferase RlmH [Bacteroidota bacterium]
MHIVLITIGKNKQLYLDQGLKEYAQRLQHYVSFKLEHILSIKKNNKLPIDNIKNEESKLILKKLTSSDYVVLLDSNGAMLSSSQFANKLQKWLFSGKKRIVFIIGGAYGFAPNVYSRADQLISLSKMTFSHQMIRLFFAEQLYRAYTLLNNEPYHHQ